MLDKDAMAPYREAYSNPNGPGDARPTALQVIRDSDVVDKWAGKIILITGANTGIGFETARALHATGADVFITARTEEKAKSAVAELSRISQGSGKLDYIVMDMEALINVRRAAQAFLNKSNKLNILINNAGMMGCPETRTVDGFERHFAVNHLAPFTLTASLLPTLIASSEAKFKSRVVFVSSSSHRYCSVKFENYNLEGEYKWFMAYGQSKTANNWTSHYLDRVYGAHGVHSLCVMPGSIWTGLTKYAAPEDIQRWKQEPATVKAMETTEQGAATTIWAAVSPVWEGKGGKYLSACSVASLDTGDQFTSASDGHGPDCYNKEGEDHLWELSVELTGVGIEERDGKFVAVFR